MMVPRIDIFVFWVPHLTDSGIHEARNGVNSISNMINLPLLRRHPTN